MLLKPCQELHIYEKKNDFFSVCADVEEMSHTANL